jgi:hypothetical protein
MATGQTSHRVKVEEENRNLCCLQHIHLHVLVPVVYDNDDDDVVGEEGYSVNQKKNNNNNQKQFASCNLTNCNERCRD